MDELWVERIYWILSISMLSFHFTGIIFWVLDYFWTGLAFEVLTLLAAVCFGIFIWYYEVP